MTSPERAGRLRKPGTGGTQPGSSMRIFYCGFDRDTTAEMVRRARKARTSVAEQIRQMVELGLETAKLENL